MRKDRSNAEPEVGSSGVDDRRDPSDPPPALGIERRAQEPVRRRTPTIPYGVTSEPDDEVSPFGELPLVRGVRARHVDPAPRARPINPEPPKLSRSSTTPVPLSSSERYERLTSSVEFTGAKEYGDESYDLEEALSPHLAWLTDDDVRKELFKQLKKGDHGRVLSVMVEERRRYPRNLSIGRAIQIVERAAIARLLAHIGPLELVPQRTGQPTLGRDPILLFRLVDGKATFEEILRSSPFPRLRSLEILGELVRRRAVRVHDDLSSHALPIVHPGGVAKLRGSMRPRIDAPVPFTEEDVGARATIPDPLEVATRAALLRTPHEVERTPQPKAHPSHAPTPPKPAPGIREQNRGYSSSGFRGVGVNELADPPTPPPRRVAPRVDERSDPLEPAVTKKASRRAAVHIAPVGLGPLGSTARRSPYEELALDTPRPASAMPSVPCVEEALPPRVTVRSPTPPAPEALAPSDGVSEEKPTSQRAPDTKRGAERVTIEVTPAPPSSDSPGRTTLESVVPTLQPPAPFDDGASSRSSGVSTPSPREARGPTSNSTPHVATNDEPMRARSDDSRERRLRVGVLGLAALAVLLSLVAVGIALTRHETPLAVAPPQPAPTPTTAPVQQTAPPIAGKGAVGETLHLVVDASPREARVYLDDVLLTGHPVNQILQRDGKPHQLRVEAAGYRPRLEKFDATGDTRLIMSLELLPPKILPAPPPSRPEEIYP